MKRTMRPNWIAVFVVFCVIGSLSARAEDDDDSWELFANPISVQMKFVPQYFVQLITNDTRYVSIEALINDDPQQPQHEVILTEKAGKRVYYGNSAEDVNSLKVFGEDAYYAPIEFTALELIVSSPIYRIRLHDCYGQEIVWTFIVNTSVSEAEAAFMSTPEHSGFVLMYADNWAAAATGTAITIGDKTESALESSSSGMQDSARCHAFYAVSLTITEITPGFRLSYVNSVPNRVKNQMVVPRRLVTILRSIQGVDYAVPLYSGTALVKLDDGTYGSRHPQMRR
jgi:hypothetical protein